MKLEELKPSKRGSGQWLAAMEDGSCLRVGEEEVLSFSLYSGRELTEDELERLVISARRSKLRERAVNLLSCQAMSRWELEKKLSQRETPEEEVLAVCDRMEELGLLNDAAYAMQVVRYLSAKGYGARKLRHELCRRGIQKKLWDEALEQAVNPQEAIENFLRQKRKGSPTDPGELQKLSNALMRRGFSWDEIREGLQRFGAEVWEE